TLTRDGMPVAFAFTSDCKLASALRSLTSRSTSALLMTASPGECGIFARQHHGFAARPASAGAILCKINYGVDRIMNRSPDERRLAQSASRVAKSGDPHVAPLMRATASRA